MSADTRDGHGRSVSLVSSGSSTLEFHVKQPSEDDSTLKLDKLDSTEDDIADLFANSTPSRSLSTNHPLIELDTDPIEFDTVAQSDDNSESDEFVDAPEVDEPEGSLQDLKVAYPGSPNSRSIHSPSQSLHHRNSESHSSVQSLYVGGREFLGLPSENLNDELENQGMNDTDKEALKGMINDFNLNRRAHSSSGKMDSHDENRDRMVMRDVGTGALCAEADMEELTTMQKIDEIRTRDQAYDPQRIKIRRPGGLDGFEGLFEVQKFSAHSGILRVACFNKRGNLLATAGADMALKLWTVCGCSLDRNRWRKERDDKANDNKPAPGIIINEIPYKQYYGHKKDILDLSWSDHDFIITASMDKTVILWHHSKEGPLRVFTHGDGVTGVCFRQSQNASLFLSCTINSRASLWDARRKRVVSFVEADSNVCTSIAVSPNGRYAVVGLDSGQLLFYEIPESTHEMSYFTTVETYTSPKKAKKVTGIIYDELDDTYDHGARCVIVTTNDGKVRVFDTRNYELITKYCGTHNTQGYQIRAHVQNDYLICGSDQNTARVWKTCHTEGRRQNSSSWFKKRDFTKVEKHISWDPHPGRTVTATHFAPARTCDYVQRWHKESLNENRRVDSVLLTADELGELKVFINVTREDSLF